MTGQDLDVPAALNDLRDGIDQAGACVDAVVAGVDAVLARLPGTADAPRAATAALRRTFDAGVAWVRTATLRGGDPAVLRTAGAVWAARVGIPEIAEILGTLAEAITTFWVDVTVACAVLAAALYAAAAAAASPLGVPAALGSAVTALAVFGAVSRSARSTLTDVAAEAAARLDEVAVAQG